MSDILIHAAITENQKQLRDWVQKTVDPNGIYDETWFSTETSRAGVPIKGKTWTDYPMSNCPLIVKCWNKYLKPKVVTTHANGFKVCDTSGYFRCGASCTWCVPPGVTSVQFQLWGHGGGNSGQCCCGATPFGPSGGYMVSTVAVTPGQCYCLCAGCAYCCYANQTTPGMNYVPTFITSGNTGYSVCVDGAYSCIPQWNADVGGNAQNSCQMPTQDGCSPQSCSGWNFCWDSNDDDFYVPHAFSSQTWHVLNAASSVNYGVPGTYPSFCISKASNLHCNSCQIAAPVFGFEGCTCTLVVGPSMCDGYGGCYYSAQNGIQQIPAMGGYGGYVCGGYSPGCGDAGGMGMICVSYNCN